MRLRQIEVLHSVMVAGTVTAAARALHLTQPAVTHAIAALERELGYPLFERRAGRLVPTEEAQLLFQDSDALVRRLGDLRELARRLKPTGERATLRVVAAPALCATLLPSALATFTRERPAAAVSVTGMLSADAAQAVARGHADLAFTFGGTPHAALIEGSIARLSAVCIAPRGHFGRRSALAISDLAGNEVLLAEPVDPLSRALWDACVDAGLRPSRQLRIQPLLGILGLVREGVAIGVVDVCTASLADPRRIDVIPLEADFPFAIHTCHSAARSPGDDGEYLVAAVRAAAAAMEPGHPTRRQVRLERQRPSR